MLIEAVFDIKKVYHLFHWILLTLDNWLQILNVPIHSADTLFIGDPDNFEGIVSARYLFGIQDLLGNFTLILKLSCLP